MLAVIVILAIIALIATPLILNVIDDAKKGAFKNSAYGIIEAAELSYALDMLNGDLEEITITYDNYTEHNPSGKKLQYKGQKPKDGEIRINKDGKIAMAISDGKYCAIKPYHLSKIAVKKMDVNDCKFEKLIDDSGANVPILVSGMTPIKWDENNNEIETNANDYDWFNYEQKRWANAKTKDGSYWVWIPRFIYKISNGWHTNQAATIEVQFTKGIDDNWNSNVIGNIDRRTTAEASNDKWTDHPAFWWDNNNDGIRQKKKN